MKKTKKVAIFDPYLDSLGGGERYILELARVFEEAGYQIDLLSDDKEITKKIRERFGLSLRSLTSIPNFLTSGDLLQKTIQTSRYDCFLYVTDGSYFFSLAKKNYIYAMVPQENLYISSLLKQLKWSNTTFITHSKFVKNFIDVWTKKEAEVVYPYIDEVFFQKNLNTKKEQIVSVGRFFKHLHSKRQDFIINTFKKLKHDHKEFNKFYVSIQQKDVVSFRFSYT